MLLAFAACGAQLALLARGGSDYRSLDLGGGLLAAASTLPLVVWRRSPLAVFVVGTAASATLNLLHHVPGPPVGATIALFLLAMTSERVTLRAVAVVAVLLVAHVASAGIGEGSFPTAPILFGVLIWTLTLVAGDRVRLRRERAERSRRLAAAEERTRIARDLHDSVGHAINVILVQAGAARLLHESDPATSRSALQTIEEVARQTVGEIDQLVRSLREDEARPGLAALDTLVAQHRLSGLAVAVARNGSTRPLPPRVDQAAYRIVQEALTNAARHGAGSADVTVDVSAGELALTVRNPVDRDAPASRNGGHGLTGMRERASLLGGSLETDARADSFTVRATLPLAESEA